MIARFLSKTALRALMVLVGAPLLALAAQPLSSNVAAAADFTLPREQFGRFPKSLPQSLGSVVLEALRNGDDARFEPLNRYDEESRLMRLGSPTGILDILYEAGSTTCTASIISKSLLLTNWHCLPGTGALGKALAANFSPNYLDEVDTAGMQQFVVNPRPVESGGSDVDYAIVTIDGDPSRRFGTVKLAAVEPRANASFIMFHHPGGQPKQVTRFGCRAAAPKPTRGARLLHLCDTLPGSSGAPIISDDTGYVIALHHAGAAKVNLGVLVSEIAAVSPVISDLVGTDPVRTVATRLPAPDLQQGLAALDRGDYGMALEIIRAHATRGDGLAEGRLGFMYFQGLGTAQNLIEAAKWFELAARKNDPVAATNLAVMYENGLGIPPDPARATTLYLQAAKGGDAVAQYNLATMYYAGRGLDRDLTEAARWYGRAAEQGDLDAQYNLGLLLETGRGLPRNRAAAIQMYRRAALSGHAAARTRLNELGE